MNIDRNTVLRMRDVGCALYAASEYGFSLNRIGLQKYIYLADSLSRLFEVLAIKKGYETYKHGPYDRSVQNAVDCLCFRRLAQFTRSSLTSDGLISNDYDLSDAGRHWVHNLIASPFVHQRWELMRNLAVHVNAGDHWRRLRELVYAEPTFVNIKAKGWGQALDVGEGTGTTSLTLINAMRLALTSGFPKTEPKLDLLLTLYFQYLDTYAHLQERLR